MAQSNLVIPAFNPIESFKPVLRTGAPWESIIDFATHKSFCGRRLYPRQGTILKLIYLETETMTDYDREVIEGWRESFKDPSKPWGVQPDIWDRVDYLKKNGYTHFPHVQMVMGRRASKGIIGGLLATERMAYLYSLGSWQQHFNQVPGQVAEVLTVATSLNQAVTRQFRDIRNAVLDCEYLKHAVRGDKYTEFYIQTPGDRDTIADRDSMGMSADREIATLYCKAASSVSSSGRGGTGIFNAYDEFAHVISGTGSMKTGEEIYDAFQPSLDQFGHVAMTYVASSPLTKIGKFYHLYQQGRVMMDDYVRREGRLQTKSFAENAASQDIDVDPDDLSSVAEPTQLVIQLPSWDVYRDFDRSREIPIRPGRTRCYPRWNHPVQYEPKEDGTPDERVQFRRKQRDPEKFSVERGGQFASVQDAYLNEVMVDRMFAPPSWRPRLEQQQQGLLSIQYRAHADPSTTNANFGFCIGHLEQAPPDEHGLIWPHVIIDVLKVWKPEDFPDHTIDYVQVSEELDDYLERFPTIQKMTYDQFNCLAADTLVSTGDGLLRMDELLGDVPVGRIVPLGVEVQSHHHPAQATLGYHKGPAPVRRITTRDGRVLSATPEHRMWARKGKDKPWHRDHPWGFVNVSGLEVGDWLAVKTDTLLARSEYDLTVLPQWRGRSHKADGSWHTSCDEHLGELLGLLVAEGNYGIYGRDERPSVAFTNTDTDLLDRYRLLYAKAFGPDPRPHRCAKARDHHADAWKFSHQGAVPTLLAALGLTGSGADKTVPWVIRRSPEHVVRAYLRGYFDGDGGVRRGKGRDRWVQADTTSEEVARTTQVLLSSVGIESTVWGPYRFKGNLPFWRVKVYGSHLLTYRERIGFSSGRKAELLDEAAETVRATSTSRLSGGRHRHDPPGEVWVRIAAIEDGEADCYEISVPGPETYIANGVVSHNSAGLIAHQKRKFPNIRIAEKTFTAQENQDRFEKFKSALNLGWLHSFRDDFAEEGQSLLELELKFLQVKPNGKVDHPTIGPVQTKDLCDAVHVVCTELLHESLDKWWTAINRTSVGSTNVDALRSGREQERLQVFQDGLSSGMSAGFTGDPLQRYFASEAEKAERRQYAQERNRRVLENNAAARARRNAFGSRPTYSGDRTRGRFN